MQPEISYSIRVISRYCANSGPIHSNLVIPISRYLAGTLEIEITLRSKLTNELVEYTDSELKERERSTSGYTFLFSV